MKERPIIFSAPMVRAILEGRKTQTRRIVKPQPPVMMHIDTCQYNNTGFAFWHNGEGANTGTCTCKDLKPPYGVPGDRLWVRETWGKADGYGGAKGDVLVFRSDVNLNGVRWRPSIHMPRWASRITLEVVNVRVERLQDISEEDAQAEGIESREYDYHGDGETVTGWQCPGFGHWDTAKNAYLCLWDTINGEGSSDANPWVWVIEFRRVNDRRGNPAAREREELQQERDGVIAGGTPKTTTT